MSEKTEKCLNHCFYFKTVWGTLKNEQCHNILDIVSTGKSVYVCMYVCM